MLLTTGLLVAIIAILNYFNRQPQPPWSHISLNSAISWLSTISKGYVLYTVKEGQSQLNLAVIMALALDPFTQNLVYYYSDLVIDLSQTAILSHNSVYDAVGLPWHTGASISSIIAYCHSPDPIATLELSAHCANITDYVIPFCHTIKSTEVWDRIRNCTLTLLSEDSVTNKWQAIEYTLFPANRSCRTKVSSGRCHEETLAIWSNLSLTELRQNTHPPWGPELGVQPNTNFTIFSRSVGTIYDFVLAYSNITSYTASSVEKLHCAINNIAAAITKTFRDTKPTSLAYPATTGQALTSTVYIDIHWQWIVIPVMVWLLGIITLLGTVWKGRRTSFSRWKTDIIPLLFLYQGSQDEVQEPYPAHCISL
ncbi:hypothetical protein BDV27DRAFT_147267 [Aspergillus caelatus]|uniref:Uncharacterized protein n=1 Tax=Aspergillus caelatus TaxID=61420 RepID=A0A5N6ZXU2_9EURO|nr:uncharacterized protein BDV27DRAFT_147267 [Aspergillus caelatus]KAE8362103.1 hypothetical protein BDV27DRAFT_147267 [Aspergillus caelatus]